MTAAAQQLGVVAAGHPISARAGADALRAGGNAVDAALGAMLASFACEPLLTGLGAGGYMLVIAPGQAPALLDFFVEAPGRGLAAGEHSELIPVPVSFGDAVQEFHVGAASVGTFGMPAGVCEAARRFARLPLEQLRAPAAAPGPPRVSRAPPADSPACPWSSSSPRRRRWRARASPSTSSRRTSSRSSAGS